MELQDPPRGLIVDLLTPLSDEGNVDIKGLEKLLERVTEHVHGILLASPWAGDGKRLELKARKELLENTLQIVPRQMPLFVWITGKDEAETRRNLIALQKASEAKAFQINICWVDTPLLYHSNRGLPHLYEELFQLAERPFILVNDPLSVGQLRGTIKRKNIRTSILKEMTKRHFISGIIFLGAMDRAYNYQKASRKRPNFRIYDGDESRFLEYPSLSGVISAGANLAPEKWRAITDSSLRLDQTASEYPDSLRQVWETGQILHKLRDLYSPDPASIIRSALTELGVLKSNPSSKETNHELVSTIENLLAVLLQ